MEANFDHMCCQYPFHWAGTHPECYREDRGCVNRLNEKVIPNVDRAPDGSPVPVDRGPVRSVDRVAEPVEVSRGRFSVDENGDPHIEDRPGVAPGLTRDVLLSQEFLQDFAEAFQDSADRIMGKFVTYEHAWDGGSEYVIKDVYLGKDLWSGDVADYDDYEFEEKLLVERMRHAMDVALAQLEKD